MCRFELLEIDHPFDDEVELNDIGTNKTNGGDMVPNHATGDNQDGLYPRIS